jgi:hypothetical protein
MTGNDGELKARMMAEAEVAIDKLLASAGEKEELTLSDIERLVRGAGRQVMEGLTADLVEAESEGEENRICPECGRRMRYKGKEARTVITETGEVRIERGRYYCLTCEQSVFPPGPTLESE